MATWLITIQFYTDKMIRGPRFWDGFWGFVLLVGVWLIVRVVLVLRKGPGN
jgi:hypothetical protein